MHIIGFNHFKHFHFDETIQANDRVYPLKDEEQSPNQLPQMLPILKYTRQREIEILSGVIYIHQPMLPAKCYCFNVAKINAAISL